MSWNIFGYIQSLYSMRILPGQMRSLVMDRVLCPGTHARILQFMVCQVLHAICVHLSSVRQIQCYKRIEVWLTYHGAAGGGLVVLISECDY